MDDVFIREIHPRADSPFRAGAVSCIWERSVEPSPGFAEWFRAQIQEITGVDMSQPDAGPSAELLLD